MKKPERDIERLQKSPDVTETERRDEIRQAAMWMVRERMDQRGTMRDGESREERKVSGFKIHKEAQQSVM